MKCLLKLSSSDLNEKPKSIIFKSKFLLKTKFSGLISKWQILFCYKYKIPNLKKNYHLLII